MASPKTSQSPTGGPRSPVDNIPAPDLAAPIAVDEVEENSELESLQSSTSTSITSSIRHYRYENGRRYHAYQDGAYPIPNDEKEQDRLDLFHHIFRLMNGGSLYRAPIPADAQKILDIGTGTGIWAVDFADEFPGAEVIGTDLSPIQPSWVPPNCKFYIEDVEGEWSNTGSAKYDFIHIRSMTGAIGDWHGLYKKAYDNLKPGGWIEVQEFNGELFSDDGTLAKATSVLEWQRLINEASTKFGKKMDGADDHQQRLIDAEFANVQDDIFKAPVGHWPKDKKLKELGRFNQVQVLDGIEAYSVALFTRVLGMSNEETQLWIAKARSDFKNPAFHLYTRFHFVYGQKPLTEE
ncbi:hypothetical protein FQN55_009460 [Onygenales sp. PD_40]|nr:hypothetical protein FQN55_009460 [Onygenales sp. PD_40]